MAHQIMNNKAMAYTGETPWHKLGTVISDPSNVNTCLQEAGLDWNVRIEDAFYQSGEGKFRRAKGKYCVYFVMGPQDQVFQTVTERYMPIQNSDIVEMFRQYCEAGQLTMETLGALNEGNIVWALAKYGEDYKIGKDVHSSYALLSTSHDGSLAFSGKMTDVRVVCNNTLRMAAPKTGSTKVRHTANWSNNKERIAVALKLQEETVKANKMKLADYFGATITKSETPVVVDLVTRFRGAELVKAITEVSAMKVERGNVLEAIVEKTVADADVRKTVGEFKSEEGMNRLGKAILDVFINDATMPESKNNAYGVMNAVTRQLDHFAGQNADSRLRSAWFGNYGRMKEDAVMLLDAIVAAS